MPLSRSAEDVASIIVRCQGAEFPSALRAASPHFTTPDFEISLARVLRSRPELVDQWQRWSADQRWTPSAFVQGAETGWYDGGYRGLSEHPDEAAAVADFIQRMADWQAAHSR